MGKSTRDQGRVSGRGPGERAKFEKEIVSPAQELIMYRIVLYVDFRELTLTFLLHLFDLETSKFDWHKNTRGENPDLIKAIHPR